MTLRSLGRLIAAHPLLGAGIALVVRSGLGAAPWDVFHVGLHRATGLGIGAATIVTGVAAVLVSLAVGVRPGIATLTNAVLLGACVDGGLALVPAAPTIAIGLLFEAAGLVLFGLGTGLYLSADLGNGPRDSLMVALARRRGWRPGRARAAVELSALGVGILLGGQAGIGTLLYALAIGPVAAFGIRLFAEQT